jgi:hypothetical protein
MAKDWQVVIDARTGGPDTGWPTVWSDTENRSVVHVAGFHQEFLDGPTRKEAMAIAHIVAAYMNSRE